MIGLYHGMELERHPDEAGAAIGHMGVLLPTELEFTLASWNGMQLRNGDIRNYAYRWREGGGRTLPSPPPPSSGDDADPPRLFDADPSLAVFADGSPSVSTGSPAASGDRVASSVSRSSWTGPRRFGRRDQRYMFRLGLDGKVDTPAKRRLSTFYSLGMLVQLQSSSGGNSWQLASTALRTPAATEVDYFVAVIVRMRSTVALEAAEACLELGDRLLSTPRYRTVPSSGRTVNTGIWLRAVLLTILAEPGKVPAWASAPPVDGQPLFGKAEGRPRPPPTPPPPPPAAPASESPGMTAKPGTEHAEQRRAFYSPFTSAGSEPGPAGSAMV